MSSPEINPLSGIVLYPENTDGLNRALAGQLGMATNARVSGGEIQIGAAFAIGYDPSVLTDIQKLHYPNEHVRRHLDPTDEAFEEMLMGQLGLPILAKLKEHNVAVRGIADALTLRRVDMVVPKEVTELPVATLALRRLAFESRAQPTIRLWRVAGNGVLTDAENKGGSGLHPAHPLSTANLPGHTHPRGHRVELSTATLLPQVLQSMTYTTGASEERLVRTGPGFHQVARETTTATHTATYTIPPAEDPSAARELAQLDFQNQRDSQAYDDQPHDDDAPIDLTRHTPHGDYRDRTRGDRRLLASGLDPHDNPEWRDRLQ